MNLTLHDFTERGGWPEAVKPQDPDYLAVREEAMRIARAVASVTDHSVSDLLGDSLRRDRVVARHIMWLLTSERTGADSAVLGRLFQQHRGTILKTLRVTRAKLDKFAVTHRWIYQDARRELDG